ncbi:TPA: DUF3265 domain-containing protein [Vibrio vulnificus]|nr:DUF3265 domain-containing protein [Vibrio vulnificus]
MWHAWHFQFALSSVVTALCGSFCIACLHPLTQRYVYCQIYLNHPSRSNMQLNGSVLESA